MNCEHIKTSHMLFSSTLWVLFLLLLWQMGFSVSDIVRFGQRMSANATLKGETSELVQSGFLP
jgi:hypothetical protein